MSKGRQAEREKHEPRWIKQARLYVGKTSQDYLKDNGQDWDVHKLTQIMRNHFHTVFAPALGYQRTDPDGKQLFDTLLQVQNRRNTRAHHDLPSETEVLQALLHMVTSSQLMQTGSWQMQGQLQKVHDQIVTEKGFKCRGG